MIEESRENFGWNLSADEFDWSEYIRDETGTTPLTDLFNRFEKAEKKGPKAVKRLFNKGIKEYGAFKDYKVLSEIASILRNRMWDGTGAWSYDDSDEDLEDYNHELFKTYESLCILIDDWAKKNLTEEQLSYFFHL